jgi:hypothetical protein
MNHWPGKPRPSTAGPWPAPDRRPSWEPAWIDYTRNPPAVGPTGNSPSRRFTGDRREEAYANYVDRISNRWWRHKREG